MPFRLYAGIVLQFAGIAMLPSLAAAQVTGASGAQTTNAGAVPVIRADPEELGLKVPVGDPLPGDDRRVQVKTDDDALVVAKVLVEIADSFVVILPDGRISVVNQRDATVTDRPFVGVTVPELTATLTKKFPGFKVQATKRFIYVYNTSPLFYQGTSRILETMYPGLMNYCRSRKLEVSDPPFPLVIVMFRTRKEWEDYMHGMFANTGVAAFYDGSSNRVVMYEQSDLGTAAPEIALKEIISTVAHEGVHQILHNIGVQHRLSRWPMWISEGVPEYFAPTSVDKSLRWKGAGTVNDLRMKTIDGLLKQGPSTAAARTAATTTESIIMADKLDADGYAWSWALTHYLGEKRRDAFSRYLTDVSKIQSMEKPSKDENVRLFIKHFGADFRKLDTELMNHLRKLPYVDPIENTTHYVILLSVQNGQSVQRSLAITLSPTAVQQTRQELLDKLPLSVQARATFDVRNFPSKTAAMNFARQWLNQP